MKKKKNMLRGFTLVELVVVIALFGMIIAVALGLIQPINRINRYALSTADSQGMGDELRRYIEGKLQYANRVSVYTNMSLSDDAAAPAGSIQNEVKRFRELYHFDDRTPPYAGYKDVVYVMHIDNHDDIKKLSDDHTVVGRNDRIGTVTVRAFEKGVEKESLRHEWEINSTYYNEYAFNIDIGTLIPDADNPGEFKVVPVSECSKTDILDDEGNKVRACITPNNLIFTVDMYRKDKSSGVNDKILTPTGITRNVSFKLKNVVNSVNAIIDEKIPFDDEATYNATPPVKKFNWYDNALSDVDGTVAEAGAGANDVYILYTNSIDIDKII